MSKRELTSRLGDVDDARRLPRFRDRSEMLAEQRQVRKRETLRAVRAGIDVVPAPGDAGGDPRELRGIPAIGRNVSGVSPGTHPERETLRRSERRAA